MMEFERDGDGQGFRRRIYDRYVDARHESLAPASLNGLTPRAPYLKKIVAQHFPQDYGAKIMDLGCGHGALVHFGKLAGYQFIKGIDGSKQQVDAAHALGIDQVEQGEMLSVLVGEDSETYDAIITFDVIEHFTRDEVIVLVDEIRRVLRKGGRWIIHAPNGESPFIGAVLHGDITHELAFTRISIAQLLYSSGFSNVMCYEDTPIPHGAKSAARWFLWKMIRAVLRLYIAAETGDTAARRIFTQNFLTVAIK